MGLIPFMVSWTSNGENCKKADKVTESCHPGLIAAGVLTSQTLMLLGLCHPRLNAAEVFPFETVHRWGYVIPNYLPLWFTIPD